MSWNPQGLLYLIMSFPILARSLNVMESSGPALPDVLSYTS